MLLVSSPLGASGYASWVNTATTDKVVTGFLIITFAEFVEVPFSVSVQSKVARGKRDADVMKGTHFVYM